MRNFMLLFVFVLFGMNSHAQKNSLTEYLNHLSEVKDIPFDDCEKSYSDCGDEIIWNIVKKGKSAIEPLLEKISDTSYSKVSFEDGDKIILRTGDIAYICLEQIAFIPLFTITKIQMDALFCGGYQSGFFLYLQNYSNRIKFQNQLKAYFKNTKLKWEVDNKAMQMECKTKRGIYGRYHE